MRRRKLVAAAITATTATVLATAAAVGAAPATAAPTHDGAATQAVPNTKPGWTAHARHLGSASRTGHVAARVYLAPRGGFDALRRTAEAIGTPGNAEYHHFLTHVQYVQRFGTRASTVDSVTGYLRKAGLHVTSVGASNRYVTVSGTVAAANKAFGTRLDRYQHGSAQVQAPSSAVRMPTAVASSVLAVTGLDTTRSTMKPANRPQDPPPDGFRNARPCSRSYGTVKATYQADYKTKLPKFQGKTLPYAVCGYVGSQFRGAYEGGSTLTGKGITVAITDAYAAPTIRSDINTYAKRNGDAPYAAGQYTQTPAAHYTDQKACEPSGWYGEETLDVEAVHAMAQGANIHYYAASNCNDDGFLDAFGTIVDDDSVQLVSNSWGDTESKEDAAGVHAYEQVFLQGATEGISFMYSSGDDGDEAAASGVKQADYPTSDPYVTSVGGTSSAIGANNKFAFQTGWGTDLYTLSKNGKSWESQGYDYGAGGGVSALFNKPDYQNGVVPGAARQVPDVAMDADPTTGMLVGETQTFPNGAYYDEYRIGGTSLASPLFAGMTALALQKSGAGVGLLNPKIYADRKTAFTDVRGGPPDAGNVRVDYVNGLNAKGGLTYSVRTFNTDSSLKTGPGWDDVTGVGVPNKGWLTALK